MKFVTLMDTAGNEVTINLEKISVVVDCDATYSEEVVKRVHVLGGSKIDLDHFNYNILIDSMENIART